MAISETMMDKGDCWWSKTNKNNWAKSGVCYRWKDSRLPFHFLCRLRWIYCAVVQRVFARAVSVSVDVSNRNEISNI